MPNSDFPGAGVLFENPGALSLRPESAAQLLWGALSHACRDRESPWRTPILATVSADGAPEARLLVLRAADSQTRLLEFHSDSRSAKLRSITSSPRVELCFWHPGPQLQLRAAGIVRVAADSIRRESTWARVPAESRRNYGGESAPGESLANATAIRGSDGFANFAILDVEVKRLEWLWLESPGHQRGRTSWQEGRWRAELLVP